MRITKHLLLLAMAMLASTYATAAEETNLKPIRIVLVGDSTVASYADAMLKVGKEKNVPVIDLHAASMELFGRLGDEGSADLNVVAADRTHFSRKGAQAMARLVADAVPVAIPELRPYLKTVIRSEPLRESPIQSLLHRLQLGSQRDQRICWTRCLGGCFTRGSRLLVQRAWGERHPDLCRVVQRLCMTPGRCWRARSFANWESTALPSRGDDPCRFPLRTTGASRGRVQGQRQEHCRPAAVLPSAAAGLHRPAEPKVNSK